ncbi:MAG: ABC transporter ATP-binding protein [Actinomycetota bacterium]|nr:ABC transporter ATP-binding protein [Actinomycetota bacterium]
MSADAIDLTVQYGAVTALAGVSLTALPGRVTAVVGGDGAGKTTLLRCLAGALAPDAGRVVSPDRAKIGYLPASSGLYPDLTVTENLDFRAQGYGVPRQVARQRAGEYLERAGLSGAADRLVGRLSGGMRQKLAVIAALLHRPDLLILDEPTTGVDPVSRSGLWWLIARAAADGCAVVLATTYLDEAERCAWVLVLDGGLPLASGSPEAIVAALPGTVRPVPARPAGPAGDRAWRRGGAWRVWEPRPPGGARGGAPGGAAGAAGAPLTPDLQDAVTVAALARQAELARPAEAGAA